MKKIFLLIVAFGCMAAQAQTEEIDAISATQGESTDWYRFADDDVIDVSITAQGIQFPGDPGKTYAIADGAVYTAFGTAPEEKITLSAADFTVTKDGDWVYDKTEKRVNVEFISVENPGPPADKITIYYNNDKLVRPINPGTYQVYIDIEEDNTYAAVTGITSDAWKFDIIDPLPEIKAAAIAEINAAATTAKAEIDGLAVANEVKDDAKSEIDKAVVAAEASITNADSKEQVNDAKNNALNEIDKQLANVQNYYNQLQTAITEIKYVANGAKEEIDGLGVDESAKSKAKADIGNIANTAEATINAATSKDAIDNAKTEAIAKIHDVVQTTKDMWVIVRTNVTANNWNTICMERNITAIDGATFWNVVSETSTEFILEQVEAPFPAGVGYIIRYTATELKVKYGDQKVDAPVEAKDNDLPIQGRFAEITCDEDGQNELVGNYVVYGNQLCKVTGWVTMADHRAYVIAGKAPKQAPAPHGAPRMTMPKPNSTPTGLGQSAITNHKSAMKVIENGHFRIVRDGKMYTIMGVEE